MMHVWLNMKMRERVALLIGALCCILYLLYFGLFDMVRTYAHTQQSLFMEKTETLHMMQAAQRQLRTQSPVEAITGSALLAHMTSTFKKPPFSAFPYTMEQTASGDIQVHFKQVPYQDMVQWLWDVTHHYAVSIKDVTLEATTVSGVVACQLTLGV